MTPEAAASSRFDAPDCGLKFVAGWNVPGEATDAEPAEFDTPEDAMDFIREEMRRDTEECAPDAEGPGLLARIDAFKPDAAGEFSAGFLAYHYFICKRG